MKQLSTNLECQNPIANCLERKVRNLSLNELPYEVWMKFSQTLGGLRGNPYLCHNLKQILRYEKTQTI